MRVFWTSKNLFKTAFGDDDGDSLDQLRECFTYLPYKSQKEIIMTVKIVGIVGKPSVIANKVAKILNWETKSLVWDSKFVRRDGKTVDLLIVLKPSHAFDLINTFTVDVNMEHELYHTESMMKKNGFKDLSIVQLIIPEWNHITYAKYGTWTAKLIPMDTSQISFVTPQTPEEIDIKFLLFTNSDVESGKILDLNDLSTSFYQTGKKTVFIIHGFRSSGNTKWVQDMKAALLGSGDLNVVIVDWEKGAKWLPRYWIAAANTAVVGYVTSVLIKRLSEYFNADPMDMHIIGHSLGAHVAGFTGFYTIGDVGRISGLDPAGPNFQGNDEDYRLDASDARFVDVIHTDMGVLSLGIDGAIGDVDFYPNGGYQQTGCKKISACSHERVTSLYIESITSDCEFKACKCDEKEYQNDDCKENCITMGYNIDVRAYGNYYLDTNPSYPFCTGKPPGQSRKKRSSKRRKYPLSQ